MTPRLPLLLAAATFVAAAAVSAAPAPQAPGTSPQGGARQAPAGAPAPARGVVPQPRSKRPLPDLDMLTLEGVRVRTRDLRGKVVLLDFWGTWCAPCRAAVPQLRALHARLAGSPFALVSISNDPEREIVERFVTAHGMEWDQVWDERQEVIGGLAVRRYPTYLLVDHEGNVVYTAIGFGPHVEREIEARVAAAVAAAEAAARATSPR
jgi:thiol-disulfide isomerase/thioredoxin